MTITLDSVTALAPDQASLNAAGKLMKPGKWPLRQAAADTPLVWGECQGSGANPYRVVFDRDDQGYKCSCPSRKFPCKHVLALMWMYADAPEAFAPGAPPDWVGDWLGRRRGTGAAAGTPPSARGKSLTAATAPQPEPPKDPKALARAQAAADKRAAETEAALMGAMDDLETWIADQLRGGLSGLLADLTARCRAIAARMVDGKATALAGRIDELPPAIMALRGEERLDALVGQLGKLVLLARAVRADPSAPHLRRAVATAERREDVLADPDAPRVTGLWDVVGERIRTRRDGLVSQATWLMNLGTDGPRFALLLDFFPASAGARSSAFATGDRFTADLAFYPGGPPRRAVLVDRRPADDPAPWPAPDPDPLAALAAGETGAPWQIAAPILLPEGRIFLDGGGRPWWRATGGSLSLPVSDLPDGPVLGLVLDRLAGLWDGTRLSILSAQTEWGRVGFDG
ncbi:MAG: SWIM zinc finger family protein [Pseudomonadota bacterium]